MPFALMIPIGQAVVELGFPLIKQLFSGKKAAMWVNVIEQAAQGVFSAVQAVQKLKQFQDTGVTPTNAELDAVLDESRDIHDQIQGSKK